MTGAALTSAAENAVDCCRSRHVPVGSGWFYRVHHLIGEPTQAIEVQPDRRQDASIRALAGTGENGSGGLGDVAPIQPLWAQQAR